MINSIQQKNHGNNSRITIIDTIRGLAILGILLANIQSWSGYKFMLLTDIATLPYFHLDSLFTQLHYGLIDGKFYAIFSVLFGVGFGLQYIKHQHNQAPFIRRYRRRLSLLLLFGIAHALLWSGDILTLYALMALLLVALRNQPFERILPLAMTLLSFFAIPQIIALYSFDPVATTEPLAHKNFVDLSPQAITAGFGRGDWSQVFAVNLHNLYWRWADFIPNGRITRVLGLFMLGFYLARSGYFTGPIYNLPRTLCYLALGSTASTVAYISGANMTEWADSAADIILKMLLVTGQIFLAVSYMGLLAQVFRRPFGETLLYPLTLIGRMAFTNYLLQTVIGITLFYGIGGQLWGSMGLAQLWLLALLIFSAQVVSSALWLRFFKQGPLEWLWGGLTDGKLRSNLRAQPTTAL